MLVVGLIVFPGEQAKQVLTHYREFAKTAPEELNVWVVMRQAPPLPFLPEAVHGHDVVVLAVFFVGDATQGNAHIEALQAFGDAHGAHVGVQPYVDWQKAFDPLLAPGSRNYWKSHNFAELSDTVFDVMIEYAGKLPSPQCEIFIGLVMGAPNRVDPEAMAWGHRDANFVMNVHSRWETPQEDAACIGWARDFFSASKPFASAVAYINFMTDDEGDRVESAYAANYERLVAVKRKYDPNNVHINQNIRP